MNARVGLVVAAAIALFALVFVDAEAIARRAAITLIATELDALDRTAGIRGADGSRRSETRVPVRVEIDGPAWAVSAAREAVAANDAYIVAEGPHRIAGEVVLEGRAVLVRLSLDRRGWSVHAPVPTRRRLAPALAGLPLLLGVWVWLRWRRAAVGVAVAGVLAQAAAAWWPWPAGLPRVGLADDYASSPLLAPLLGLARGLDEAGVAIAGGVIALSLVLAWFDHRRSRANAVVVPGLVAVLGGVAWIEAAGRVSLLAWATTPIGVLGAVALAMCCAMVRRASVRGGP